VELFVLWTLRIVTWRKTTISNKRCLSGTGPAIVLRLSPVKTYSFGPDREKLLTRKLWRTLHTEQEWEILVGNQLDAKFLLWYVYLNHLHVSSNYVLILRRTIVWIQTVVQLLCVSSRPVYRTATNTEWLYQKFYSYNCPPEDEHTVARNMYRIQINVS
jgi:hypothetical protein